MSTVITSPSQLDIEVSSLPGMSSPREVLMAAPTYYSVEYVINPHMADNIGMVDQIEARSEWEVLKNTFEQLGLSVHVVRGEEGLPDMVFCANQSLPFEDENGNHHVVMGIMQADERKGEVAFIEQWYRQHGYNVHHLNNKKIDAFEGCGDAIWHPGRQLLWGGYGYRSSLPAYEEISGEYNVPVIALKLMDETFYHLDTCLCILNEKTALIYPGAFNEKGLKLINTIFDNIIHASKYEAQKLLACNATCPDGKNVIIQQGCTDVNKKLRDAGFSVHGVSTYEYLKSGGSVFCMKQLVW